MRIVRAEVAECKMPKEDPKWRYALAARPHVLALSLRLETDTGLVGFGFTGESPEVGLPLVALKAIVSLMAEKAVGADPRERRPLLVALEREAQGCNRARAAFDLALYDLAAKIAGVPLSVYLGGSFRKSIPMLRILALKEPAQVAENALKLVHQGYRYLKIKLEAVDPELDAARVAAVRQAVGEKVHLTLDANQSYTPKGAIDIYERVAQYGIDLFEQPVRKDDFEGLRTARENIGCLVEADEAANSLPAIQRLLAMRAVDSIALKVLKLGGLDPLIEAAAMCRAANVACRVGADVSSRLVSSAAMHFVAATPNIGYACELAEQERLLDDPFEGLYVRDGELTVLEGIGIGVTPREGAKV